MLDIAPERRDQTDLDLATDDELYDAVSGNAVLNGIPVAVTVRNNTLAPGPRPAMYDTARAIVLSSLPPGLSRRERRLAFAKRFYDGELPEAALIAYAEWDGDTGVP